MAGNNIAMGVAYRDQLIKGTSTNDNALVGDVGELITSTVALASAVSLTSTTAANVTSISLTAGDWDVDGTVDFNLAASTSVTVLAASISLTTATLGTQPGGSGLGTDPTTTINQAASVPGGLVVVSTPTVRISIAATTTVYLVASSTFTVSTNAAYGTIRARRIR